MSKLIALTAGHSDVDPGAVYKTEREAAIAVTLRDLIVAELKVIAPQITVLTDGGVGVNKPLVNAIELCKKAGGNGVEIHLNASDNPLAKGIEALGLASTKKKAIALCAAVNSVTKFPLRGSDYGYKDQGSGQHAKLGFCQAGGIILEIGFISNPNELASIKANIHNLAKSLALTLSKF